MRELEEESGLTDVDLLREVAVLNRRVPKGRTGREDHSEGEEVWHLFLMRPRKPLPDSWRHLATGACEGEESLELVFRWLPLKEGALSEVEGVQAVCVEVFRQAIAGL